MTAIAFYTNPQSRGQIIHWMLEELGEPYDTHWVDYGEQMKGEEYLAINPMGKVPAVTHNGNVITECPAICTYLAAAYPERRLIPAASDPALADFYRWMFFAAGPLEQAASVNAMGWEVSDEQSRTLGFGTVAATLDAVEIALSKGPFICGDVFTAVDVYLGSALHWGMMFGTLEKRDPLQAYVAELVKRPALLRAQQLNEAKMAETGSDS